MNGNSKIVINNTAIRPEANTPMMQPIIIAPDRFEIDSKSETLIICFFGNPTALNKLSYRIFYLSTPNS